MRGKLSEVMKRMENRKPRLSRRDTERIEFAKQQRRDANEFSSTVWQWLRSGRMRGEKFRREYPYGPYTLDFVCVRLKLNIEIDGKEHMTEAGLIHDSRHDATCRTWDLPCCAFLDFA